MSPDEVITEAKRLYANGDFVGADRVLAVWWRDANSDRPAEVLHLLAAIRMQAGQFADAENFLRQAIKAEPNNARVRAALGELYGVAGHPTHALIKFAEAQKLDPALSKIDRVYAIAAIAAKKPAEAEVAARRMLMEGPSIHAYDTLSIALREQGKGKEALAAAEEALKLDATNHAALHSKGAALLKLGRNQEALDIFEHLHAVGTRAPKLALNRGAALMALGKVREAVDVLADGSRTWSTDEALIAAVAEARRKARPN
jgi:predicted Zn-dependent protease